MDYRVIRSRRKTAAIQVTPQGEVLVRCPVKMGSAEIRSMVESHRSWIETALAKTRTFSALAPLTQEDLARLSRQAAQVFPEKCTRFARLAQVDFGRITIRRQKTRWGSCSREGNLSFNCLLLLAPEPVLDYVVVHELCHRRQMNHSPAFWAEVAAILPEYDESRRWLKENGAALLARLPQK